MRKACLTCARKGATLGHVNLLHLHGNVCMCVCGRGWLGFLQLLFLRLFGLDCHKTDKQRPQGFSARAEKLHREGAHKTEHAGQRRGQRPSSDTHHRARDQNPDLLTQGPPPLPSASHCKQLGFYSSLPTGSPGSLTSEGQTSTFVCITGLVPIACS